MKEKKIINDQYSFFLQGMIGQQYLKKKKTTHEKDWCRHGIEIYTQSRHSDQMDEYLKKIVMLSFSL